jgi:carbamoyl-phosphate synthase large subunit
MKWLLSIATATGTWPKTMPDAIKVLVTGAGSGVGQSILKALHISDLETEVVAADIDPLNAGLYRADEAVIFPRVEAEAEALAWFRENLPKLNIDVLLIGSEFDLEFFSKHRESLEDETGTLICASPLETVQIAADKFRTYEFFKQNGLPHAQAKVPQNLAEARAVCSDYGFPVVLKTRTGTSSRHVHVLQNESELESLFEGVPNPMIQQFAGTVGDDLRYEYTCSVFKCKDGETLGPFTARRSLRSGTSWIVEVDCFAEVEEATMQIGSCLPSMGSLNVQMRNGPRGPIPFELNARFSGTTAVRAHFGFNEVDMFLKSYYLGQSIEPPKVRKGVALRYIEEVFVEDADIGGLFTGPLPHGTVNSWF